MGRLDDLKRMKATAADKLASADLARRAGDAVTGASSLIDGAESVAERSGLTNKKGEISKLKVAKAAATPGKTTRKVLGALAEEVQARPAEESPRD